MKSENGFSNFETEIVILNIMNDAGLFNSLVHAEKAPSWINCRSAFMGYYARNKRHFEDCETGFFANINWDEVAQNIKAKRLDMGKAI